MARKTEISGIRKLLFYGGMIITIIGFLLFVSVFFTAFSDLSFGGPNPVIRPIIGMLMMIVGQFLRVVGERGAAGSGMILDPQQARQDLEPHSRALGGIVSDALEEVDSFNPKEVIKIRCQSCKQLNDESALYCNQCGKALH